jgi:hypothetical protein
MSAGRRALAAAGLATFVGVALLARPGGAPADVGGVPTGGPRPEGGHPAGAEPLQTPSMTAPPADAGPGIPVPLGDVERSTEPVAVHPARLTDEPSAAVVAPVGLRLPAIEVDAEIEPVGVDDATGLTAVPEDIDRVGWYRFGPVPGEPGSAVLLGHVDSHAQGLGAFFRLGSLEPGDRVVVLLADGSSRAFTVVGRRSYAKSALPSSVFDRSGSPRLALITCGGAFDRATRHYADNVVVYAVPAG